jgi:hypothetical protein
MKGSNKPPESEVREEVKDEGRRGELCLSDYWVEKEVQIMGM